MSSSRGSRHSRSSNRYSSKRNAGCKQAHQQYIRSGAAGTTVGTAVDAAEHKPEYIVNATELSARHISQPSTHAVSNLHFGTNRRNMYNNSRHSSIYRYQVP